MLLVLFTVCAPCTRQCNMVAWPVLSARCRVEKLAKTCQLMGQGAGILLRISCCVSLRGWTIDRGIFGAHIQ